MNRIPVLFQSFALVACFCMFFSACTQGELPDKLYAKALKASRKGNYEKARELAEQARSHRPEDTAILELTGRMLFLTGNATAAEKSYRKILEKDPDHQKALFGLVSVLRSQGRNAEAEKLHQKALHKEETVVEDKNPSPEHLADAEKAEEPEKPDKTYPDSYSGKNATTKYRGPSSDDLFQKALRAFRRGNYKEARELTDQASVLSPDDTDITALSARLHLKKGDPIAARKDYEKILDKNPVHTEALTGLGHILKAAGQNEQAAEHYKKALELNPSPSAWYQLATMYYGQEEWDEAFSVTASGLEQFPGDEQLLRLKTGILEKQGEDEKALYAANNYLSLYPEDEKMTGYRDHLKAEEILKLVRKAERSGDYGEAKQLSEQAIALDPDNTNALYLAARIHNLTGDTDKAEDRYNKTLEKEPGHTGALIGLGGILKRKGHAEKAAELYKKALKEEQSASVYYQLASAYYEQEAWKPALSVTESALERYPEDKQLLNLKIGILERQGTDKAAVRAAATYMEYYPEDQDMLQHYRDLRSKGYKNRVGITHMQSFFDNDTPSGSISSLEYVRFLKNTSTIIGRVDYRRWNSDGGFQYNLESYHKFNDTYYGHAMASASNGEIFPEWKLGYSLFRAFPKGWEGELGGRMMRVEDVNLTFGIASVGKYWGDYWLNLRGFLIHDGGTDKFHQSYVFTGRRYLNDARDHLSLIFSLGTSPDDRSRNFQYDSFTSFINKSVGLGYYKSITPRLDASLNGTWNYLKIGNDSYLNRFDIYFGVNWKF